MQTRQLTCHPAQKPLAVTRVESRILTVTDNWFRIRWRVDGSTRLVIPKFAGKGRADNLWQTTCFELFMKPTRGTAYSEFNFSPSERWAAYDFTDYREGMSERPFAREPNCVMRVGRSMAIFDVEVPRTQVLDPPCQVGLSAVIEEEGGVKTYWALSHEDPEKPDFHNAACFTASLERTRAA